jgi:hypothetical protein
MINKMTKENLVYLMERERYVKQTVILKERETNLYIAWRKIDKDMPYWERMMVRYTETKRKRGRKRERKRHEGRLTREREREREGFLEQRGCAQSENKQICKSGFYSTGS